MIRNTITIILSILAILSIAFSNESVSISGVVVDSDFKPVKKVTISLIDSNNKKIAGQETSKDGLFNFKNIVADNYTLKFYNKKKGSASVLLKSWPKENIDIKDLKIKLTKGKSEEQVFTFGPKPEESITLSDISQKPNIKENIKNKNIYKIPKRKEKVSINGRVKNQKGKPLKKVKIMLIDENFNVASQIETDKLGLFNIENLKPANYTFTATLKKKTVKYKLKAWPKNNQDIKDLRITLTKEKQAVETLAFGPEPPRADAGPDQEIGYEKLVTIDGSSSYNPNDIIESYEWYDLSETINIEDNTKPMFTFKTPIEDKIIQFVLIVKGPGNIIDEDTISVNVYNKNIFPISDAGPDLTVDISEPILLDGSKSNDPDGEIKSYKWRQISGEKTSSKNWNQSVINVSTISTFEDTLSFELTVEDKYNSDIDTVNVFVIDIPEPLVLLTSSSSANEGTSMAKISLGVSAKSGKKTSIHVKTHDSTATGNGKDYTNINKIIDIPALKSRITFPLNINNDNIDEYDEILVLKIIDTTVTNANTGPTRTHILTIIDDDDPPLVEFLSSNTTVSESIGSHYVIIKLSNQSGKDITVNYQIHSSSSAAINQDYMLENNTATFPAGTTRDTLYITINDDLIDEPSQNIVLNLYNPNNATIGIKSIHTIKINDNDPAPYIYVKNEKASAIESDSSQSISYALSSYSEKEVTVDYRVSSYGTTSRKNKDYYLENGTLTIPIGVPGEANIPFTLIDDSIDEFDELLVVNLVGQPQNATLGSSTRHTFTIIDNDQKPTLEFSGDDHGNDFGGATRIAVGSKTHGIIELGGDLDVFRFDLNTPTTILVKSSGNTDLIAEILDNAGRLLSSDDNSKDSNNFMMKLPLLPGPHFIRTKHYSSSGTGDYTLTLESSEMYDRQADDLILNKTKAYFHTGHVIYRAHFNNDKSYYVERIQIDSVLFNLDSKRFITISVNDSIQINPSLCYVASYGKYENLGIIQKNYISNPLNTQGLPRYLPEEILTNSLIFGVVRDYNTREPIFGAEVRLYGMPPSKQTSQTSIIELSKGQTWVDGGTRMPTKKPLYSAPKINDYRSEKGRRITGVNGKYAIAVRDTGFLVIKANAPTNNYRYQEKKIKIRNKKGDFYSTDIWLIPK